MWKAESMLDVVANTWGLHVDAGAAAYLSAQSTYLSSTATGGTNAALTALSALVSSFVASSTVTLNDSTGKITITFGSGTHTLTWDSTVLRNLLGFTGTLTPAAASFTAPNQATPLWLPNCPSPADLGGSLLSLGTLESDQVVQRANSGALYVTGDDENIYTVRTVRWGGLTAAKTWRANESTVNESAESFYRNWLAKGTPFRLYTDRTDDTTWQTAASEDREYVLRGGFVPTRMGGKDVAWIWEMDLLGYA